MWNLYTLAKTTHRLPSEILRLEEHVRRTYGLDGWWTCYNFDQAVIALGLRVEYLDSLWIGEGESRRKAYTMAQILNTAPRSETRIEMKPRNWRQSPLFSSKPPVKVT